MSSVLESLKEQFSPEVVRSVASKIGESTGSVQLGLQGGAAVILTALASKAKDQDFLSHVKNLSSSFSARSRMGAADAGSSVTSATAQASNAFLNMLFGGNLSNITSKLAENSHMRSVSAGCVMAVAAPMVLGTLASKVNSEGLSVSGFSSMLTAELPRLRSALPAGFSIHGLAGVPSHIARDEDVMQTKGDNWFWALVFAALLLIGLIWFVNRSDSVNTAVSNTTAVAAQAGSGIVSGTQSLGALVQSSLPDGVDLNIPQNGMESKLLLFIKDPSAPVTDTTWFNFDRLLFDSNSATLQSTSREQLQNIANILKAYPNVYVRIGGYTDNQGDATANLRLSTDRADNVMMQLLDLGVDRTHVNAKGYGEDHPVADNSTEAGRAQNRRISLRVIQK